MDNIAPLIHGIICLEAGKLVDVLAPLTQDILPQHYIFL